MKLTKVKTEVTELDMTPMIDMTFQLIAFFMMLINFSEGDQNERIQLPSSELAKPAVSPLESPITLHVTDKDSVIIGGQEISVDGLKPFLDREASVLTMRGKSPAVATVIIRGDMDAKTITVQDVIKVCQLSRFEKFVLRAKEERGY
ncbi:MAG: biopolymer transporter ExbD [Pirellulaceae bacterium]|jgi:biopolymer transport protein ExbD|nr:biopolymer transporter ExbD [Pirellulaceae bacterium]MCU0982908.1 biopolymer transporter ExbD [Pirellulaceae bacterium]